VGVAATRTRRLVASSLAVCLWAAPAAAQDPAPGSPGWFLREASNYAAANGRVEDWAAHPDRPQPGAPDPRRAIARWDGVRGEALAIEYRNRYDARIVGHLWRPKDARGPLPAVVFVNGAGLADDGYFWAAEDLAERGYLVMTFDPQGAGGSDTQPAPQYCEAGGEWTRPQEMGITEQGQCAGVDPPEAQLGEVPGLTFVITGKVGNEDARGTAGVYRQLAPRFVFGALDAVTFLLSTRNPWRASVDAARVGVAGHSIGAWAAMMVAGGDPLRRFSAAVAMDAYHGLDFGAGAGAPTLFIQGEQENVLGPRTVPPSDPRSPDQLHATRGAYAALRSGGTGTGFFVLRGSTHSEFTDQFVPASRSGQRVASYLMLAWLDAHLRDGAAARRGRERLHADRFDDSADVSSIGTGRHDPQRGNIPYRLAGMPVPDALSFYYPSDLYDGARECRDLRLVGCPPPPPPPRAACRSRRVVTLRLGRLSAATVTVEGRRIALRRTGRGLAARIDLRGLSRRTVTVRVRGRDRHGKRVRLVRRYRLCVRR